MAEQQPTRPKDPKSEREQNFFFKKLTEVHKANRQDKDKAPDRSPLMAPYGPLTRTLTLTSMLMLVLTSYLLLESTLPLASWLLTGARGRGRLLVVGRLLPVASGASSASSSARVESCHECPVGD